MKMRSIYTLIFCAVSYISVVAQTTPNSDQVENQKAEEFVTHTVEEGETLYSLSRKYNIPIYEIIKNNPPTEFGLEPGQKIKIPKETKKPLTAEFKPEVKEPAPAKEKVTEETIEEKTKEEPVKPIEGKSTVNRNTDNIQHTVEEKQTLFAISRLYNVSVEDIKKWNNLISNDLTIGQILMIRLGNADAPSNQEEKETITPVIEGMKTHKVKPSETLYSISRLYSLSVPDLKKWNNLSSNEISIDQVLMLQDPTSLKDSVEVKETPVIVVEEVKVDKPKKESKTEVIDTAKYNIKPERKLLYNEVFESGLAEQIEGSSNNRKYLALHKTAEVGTIIKVKNEMNDQEVFVRVIGKLPDTSVNNNIVIKLSKSAYERLGAIDPKFRVSISYIP